MCESFADSAMLLDLVIIGDLPHCEQSWRLMQLRCLTCGFGEPCTKINFSPLYKHERRNRSLALLRNVRPTAV